MGIGNKSGLHGHRHIVVNDVSSSTGNILLWQYSIGSTSAGTVTVFVRRSGQHHHQHWAMKL